MTNKITLNQIYNYNAEILPNLNNKSLLEVLNHNKRDIKSLINELYKSKETLSVNINKIRKNLKKKSKKFVITKEYNQGNLYSIGANIEGKKDSYNLIILPIGECVRVPNAEITFLYKNKNKMLKNKFNQIIVALRSNKVSFNYEIYKDTKNINKLKLSVTDTRDNNLFWHTIKLWSKH